MNKFHGLFSTCKCKDQSRQKHGAFSRQSHEVLSFTILLSGKSIDFSTQWVYNEGEHSISFPQSGEL